MGKSSAKLEVLGVFKLDVTPGIVQQQADRFLEDDLSPEEREEGLAYWEKTLNTVVLVEVMVQRRDDRFSVIDFSQGAHGNQEAQAAWCEVFLTPDGWNEIAVPYIEVPEQENFRIAFYMHFWNTSLPLQTSCGNFECPLPTVMPERLKRLAPFEPVD